VVTLEDLLAMSATKMDGSFGKIKLTEGLPKAQGIYRFIGGKGETLYIGKATDLRARVRSYFYGDPRRKIRDLLRQTQGVTYETFPTMLEAEVAEARAIAAEMPPHNRAGKRRATWYVKVGKDKVSPTRVPKDDGRVYLGPLPSIKHARLLIDALRDAAGIHRCSDPRRCGGCAFAELGRCAGTDRSRHADEVALVERALRGDPSPIFEPLAARMTRLARQERFEEAAELRDRAAALQRVLERHAEVRALMEAGCLRIRIGDERRAVTCGRLGETPASPTSFIPPQVYSEARVILSWLKRHAHEVALEGVTGTWAMAVRRSNLRFEVQPERPTS
jgi:DNA polymerase-3 subunit epsilon